MGTENTLKISEKEHRIGPGKVVRLRYWAHERVSGELLQHGDDLYYLHGGYGGVFAPIEARLEGMGLDDRLEANLDPVDGYGEHDPQRIIEMPREQLPAEAAEIGQVVFAELDDGSEQPYVVIAADEHTLTLDGNHPWAGKQLAFRFEIMEIRDSQEAERRAGFPFC